MTLRDRVELVSYRAVTGSFRAVPLGVAKRVASWLGRLGFLVLRRYRNISLTNLELAYPELSAERRREIARASFEHLAWNMVDFARAERWGPEELAAHVDLVGMEHVHAALERGCGLLMLTPHLGNFELGVRRASLAGLDPLFVGRPMRNTALYEYLRSARTRFGGELVDRDEAAPRMLRALRKNRPVAVLNDHYISPRRGAFAPFFGLRASTAPGVAFMAVRTGAPVCTAHILRDGPDHHTVYISPPLDVPTTGDRERDIELALAAHNAAYEAIIRKHPEQWLWGNRRFRHSPDLEADPYRRSA
jgi:KDO2-lipid IV(A) lauroyltransferase